MYVVLPLDFEPDEETVKMIESSGISTYELSHEPSKAVKGADVIYTDVWASMGQKDEASERVKVFQTFKLIQN